MEGLSPFNADLVPQYKVIGRCPNGRVKIQDLKTGTYHRLPINRLLQFPGLLEAFSAEDRQRLCFFAEGVP